MTQPLFDLGQIVSTPDALAALEEADQSVAEIIQRHASGDWNELDEHDRRANEDALKHGARIFSVYGLKTRVSVWVITEADRSSTCVLLPENY